MSDKDYEDILDQNVDEAKDSIRELQDPNYQELLEIEKDNRDRKTIKEFLESKIEASEEEEQETEAEEVDEEPLLEDYSKSQILSGGLIAGVVLGLVIGFGFTMTDSPQATPGEIEDSLMSLFEASGEAENIEITEIEQRSGMYYATVEVTAEIEGETREQVETFYISPDGNLLFPEMQEAMMQNPINIEETIAQMEQMQDMPEQDLEIEGDEELDIDEEDIELEDLE